LRGTDSIVVVCGPYLSGEEDVCAENITFYTIFGIVCPCTTLWGLMSTTLLVATRSSSSSRAVRS